MRSTVFWAIATPRSKKLFSMLFIKILRCVFGMLEFLNYDEILHASCEAKYDIENLSNLYVHCRIDPYSPVRTASLLWKVL